MIKRSLTIVIFFFSIFLYGSINSTPAQAQVNSSTPNPNVEQVIDYRTEVFIYDNATLSVRETIKVNVLGQEIKRGIYREFPTKYETSLGINSNTSFDIVSVKKDGRPEPYFTENMTNGVRLYIGVEDIFLDNGIYTYEITYETERQFTYFEDRDGLFYNFTGNGWTLPILQSEGIIHIPAKLSDELIETGAYWGPQGVENISGIEITPEFRENETVIYYKNSNYLDPYEGFSGYVYFPKGVIKEYSQFEEIMLLVIDNVFGFLTIGVALASFLAAYLIWRFVGKDPEGKTAFPQYKIPDWLTPGLARYISNMGYDTEVLTATIISLAIKGHLKIFQGKKGILKKKTFTIEKLKPKKEVELTPDEEVFMQYFMEGRDEVVFENKYDTKLRYANEKFEQFFNTNYSDYHRSNMGILFTYMLIVGFSIVGIIVFSSLLGMFSILSIPGLILAAIPILLLSMFIKSRTKEGREKLDYIEGLAMFISATEEEKIKIMHKEFPKDMDTFNKYFPYALALGIETVWLKQFKTVLEKANLSQEQGVNNYGWYVGSYNMINTNFGNSLNSSLSSTISSSATPPSSGGSVGGFGGSSSGGFSGGSGGGGGGGGGGGW